MDCQNSRQANTPRHVGIALGQGDGSIFVYERLFPGAVVAPRNVGQRVSRADLLYHGAEPVVDFTP